MTVDTGATRVDASEEAVREALIYVPGLASLGVERKTTTGVVRRVARALNQQDRVGPAAWRAQWLDAAVGASEPVDDKPLATIWRKEPSGEDEPFVDVFEYAYEKALIEGWERSSLFKRAGQVFVAGLNLRRVYRSFVAAGHSERGRAQLAVATVMLACMGVYAGVLLIAVLQAGQQIYQTVSGEAAPKVTVQTQTTAEPALEAPVEDAPPGVTVPQWAAIAGALIASTARRVGTKMNSAGTSLFALNAYLDLAVKRTEVTGGLEDLCERLRSDQKYSTVRMVGYSFGAVVALEALHPRTDEPPPALCDVASLVTIGVPSDFVLAVKPDWFQGRHGLNVDRPWLNVYSPIDLLGSKFPPDADEGQASRGISATDKGEVLRPSQNKQWNLGVDLTLRNLVLLAGFTSHGMYWGEDAVKDHNVFDHVVRHLYKDAGLLTDSR
jgi:hypothetical protein